jgi:UDP-N-acetylglucosamine 4-epimerase
MQLMALQSPQINGDGTNSRDFTYIQNVVQMNHLAATTDNPFAKGQVFNTAVGERADLNMLTELLKKQLAKFNPEIASVIVKHGTERKGDIPHSLASIEKAKKILGYSPSHNLKEGLLESVDWYWNNLKDS